MLTISSINNLLIRYAANEISADSIATLLDLENDYRVAYILSDFSDKWQNTENKEKNLKNTAYELFELARKHELLNKT